MLYLGCFLHQSNDLFFSTRFVNICLERERCMFWKRNELDKDWDRYVCGCQDFDRTFFFNHLLWLIDKYDDSGHYYYLNYIEDFFNVVLFNVQGRLAFFRHCTCRSYWTAYLNAFICLRSSSFCLLISRTRGKRGERKRMTAIGFRGFCLSFFLLLSSMGVLLWDCLFFFGIPKAFVVVVVVVILSIVFLYLFSSI